MVMEVNPIDERELMAEFDRLEVKIRARFYMKRLIADLALAAFALISSVILLALAAASYGNERFTPLLLGGMGMGAITLAMVILSVVHGALWLVKHKFEMPTLNV